jgi:hypothetical protein
MNSLAYLASIPLVYYRRGSRIQNSPDLGSREKLHSSLLDDLKKGAALWLRLDGLSLENLPAHAALCQTLTQVGFGTDRGSQKPDLVVLDWSRVSTCSAEGFAFFAVLANKLATHGMRVISCEPESAAIAAFLTDSGLRNLGVPIRWVLSPNVGRRTLKCPAPSAAFSISDILTLEGFLHGLSNFLRTTPLNRDSVRLVMATAHECIQNVLSHSSAEFAAAVALAAGRSGAPSIQLGIADDGIGIASSIASHSDHSKLANFTDSSVTETVLNQKLSRRPRTETSTSSVKDSSERVSGEVDADQVQRKLAGNSGGGMGRLIKRLLEHPGVTIRIRSGTAFVFLQSPPGRSQKLDLTFGAGTQLMLSMRFP